MTITSAPDYCWIILIEGHNVLDKTFKEYVLPFCVISSYIKILKIFITFINILRRKIKLYSGGKILILIAVLLIISGCSIQYNVITANQFIQMKDINLAVSKFIVINNEVIQDSSFKSKYIVEMLRAIYNKNKAETNSIITGMEVNCKDSDQMWFCRGLYAFHDYDYVKAISCLKKYDADEFKYLKHVYIGFAKMELRKRKLKRYSDKEILSDYQTALNHTDDEKIKESIRLYVRYIRHGV